MASEQVYIPLNIFMIYSKDPNLKGFLVFEAKILNR